jgi:hypothetical protein
MRKTQRIVITNVGRDRGKIFHIKEMPALQIERWTERLFQTLTFEGVEIPEETLVSGFLGFTTEWIRWLSHLRIWELQPFLLEMDECITRQPRLENPETRPLINCNSDEDDVQEWMTWLTLRINAVWLHADFIRFWKPMDFIPRTTAMVNFAEVKNVPRIVAAAVSFDKATLTECDTVYGLEALYMILEIVSVDNHNKQLILDAEAAK